MITATRVGIGTAGVVALAVLFFVYASREKRQNAATYEATESMEATDPSEPDIPTAESPPPPSQPSALAQPVPPKRVEKVPEKQLDESALLTALHDLAATNPLLSLRLAKEAVNRFPDSPNAPEFEWHVVKSLFNMERIEEAKEEAMNMLWKYPGNEFTNDVDHHLLNHPPNPSDLQK